MSQKYNPLVSVTINISSKAATHVVAFFYAIIKID